MMISRLFRTPTSPGKLPVTDANVAPEKDGMGILIRKLVRKRSRQTPSLQSMTSHETEGDPAKDVVPSDPEGSEIRDTTENSIESAKETETSTASDTKSGTSGTPQDELPYFPRPGDICAIRYDCYLLSPLEMDRDRHGRLRISESQQFQNRKRTWVEGNFDNQQQLPPVSTRATTEIHPGQTNDAHDMESKNYNHGNQTGQPYSSNFHEDPYYDGEKSEPLQLPALEFEVGHGDVIRGLEVVVQRMAQGEIVEATIPHLFAYGYNGLYPRIPPKTDLLFVVKLERVFPSATNVQKAAKGFDEPHTATRRTIAFSQDLALFCCGLFEGTFMVLFGIAIPVFLLLRSELDLEEIIQELVGASNHG